MIQTRHTLVHWNPHVDCSTPSTSRVVTKFIHIVVFHNEEKENPDDLTFWSSWSFHVRWPCHAGTTLLLSLVVLKWHPIFAFIQCNRASEQNWGLCLSLCELKPLFKYAASSSRGHWMGFKFQFIKLTICAAEGASDAMTSSSDLHFRPLTKLALRLSNGLAKIKCNKLKELMTAIHVGPPKGEVPCRPLTRRILV